MTHSTDLCKHALTLNHIDAFSYDLVLALVPSTILRARNYRVMIGLIYSSSVPARRITSSTLPLVRRRFASNRQGSSFFL